MLPYCPCCLLFQFSVFCFWLCFFLFCCLRSVLCSHIACFSGFSILWRGRRSRDRMIVEFKTTYAISAYHHWCCEFESRSGRGVQHFGIKFVSDLRQVDGFLRVLPVSSPNKTYHHDIPVILLKVALNTIKSTNQPFLTAPLVFSKLYLLHIIHF